MREYESKACVPWLQYGVYTLHSRGCGKKQNNPLHFTSAAAAVKIQEGSQEADQRTQEDHQAGRQEEAYPGACLGAFLGAYRAGNLLVAVERDHHIPLRWVAGVEADLQRAVREVAIDCTAAVAYQAERAVARQIRLALVGWGLGDEDGCRWRSRKELREEVGRRLREGSHHRRVSVVHLEDRGRRSWRLVRWVRFLASLGWRAWQGWRLRRCSSSPERRGRAPLHLRGARPCRPS